MTGRGRCCANSWKMLRVGASKDNDDWITPRGYSCFMHNFNDIYNSKNPKYGE
jgi:hypothetical protein